MTLYKGTLTGKDSKITCECQSEEVERKMNEYQSYMSNCLREKLKKGLPSSKEYITRAMSECSKSYGGSRSLRRR